VPRLGTAIVLLVAGVFLAGWAARTVSRVSSRTSHIDPTVRPFLGTVVRYAVLILFLIAALGQLGVQTASLLAVLGAAGLAVGLALQGTLQNIAAGIMLIYLRPFPAWRLHRNADHRRQRARDRAVRHAPRDRRRALLLRP
jgi:small conductance mechanosensitive channel